MKLKVESGVLLSILECVAVKDVRYYLNGICFTSNGFVVGTNGHILGYGKHENKNSEDVIVLVGKLPTRKFSYAIFDTDSEIVKLYSCFDVVVGVAICTKVNAKFPDIEKVISSQSNVEVSLPSELSLNTEYIGKIVKIGKIITPRFPCVTFSLRTKENAISCNFGDIDNGGVKLILMPMRDVSNA
ncbi:TPA: hypothetical protein JRS25_004099 [Escherichia coli]|nr:hypothetical protein [Escherichia coli]